MSTNRAVAVDQETPGRFVIPSVPEPDPERAEAHGLLRAISLNRGEIRRPGMPTGWRPGWDPAGTGPAAADGLAPGVGARARLREATRRYTNGVRWGAALLAALALAGCCTPPTQTLLSVPLHGQHQSNWCWAASGQMTTEYFGHAVSQCQQVNDQKGLSNCCNLPTPSACNLGGTTHIDNYGFTRTVVTSPISFKSLECELSSDKRAMIFDLRWDGGGGHTIVLRGYDATNNEQWLWVNNPLPVDAGNTYLLKYDDYVDGPGYSYGRTEWGIKYTGGK